MKRYSILALALVLGCTVLAGCRRGSGNMETIVPTTAIATERPTAATTPATQPTAPIMTEPATHPATEANPTEGASGSATESTTGETQSGARHTKPGSR